VNLGLRIRRLGDGWKEIGRASRARRRLGDDRGILSVGDRALQGAITVVGSKTEFWRRFGTGA